MLDYKPVRLCFILSQVTIALLILIIFVLKALTYNLQRDDEFGIIKPVLPSKLFDIKGRLISQFISEENREMLPLKEMPDHLINSLLIREDFNFFSHKGINFRGIFRAGFNILLSRYFSGGSSITQQLGKLLYTDQAKRSILRKIQDMWWALQLESKLSKYEILEMYLNKVYFGNGNYGIETAAKFFFNKAAKEINTAEAVLLVIQLSNPRLYSPFYNPAFARSIQEKVLEQIANENLISLEKAKEEFNDYWDNYDWKRAADSSALSLREDKAPYFSEYVRQNIVKYIPLNTNLYKDGFNIYTTLDLEAQYYADKLTKNAIDGANKVYKSLISSEETTINREVVPLLDIISDLISIKKTRVNGKHFKKLRERKFYQENISLIASLAAITGSKAVHEATNKYYLNNKQNPQGAIQVEGAFIAIDTKTGGIRAMVGGSGFSKANEFNRATQSTIQPGSTFKPLYYAAALDLKIVTPATLLSDSPVAFISPNGEIYAPENYFGRWRGNVLLRRALALSLNIPSLRILDKLGLDNAVNYSAKLIGLTRQSEIERALPKVYPLALGVGAVSPLQMTRAFAIFGNNGREVNPHSIRYIEDRNGKIIINRETEIFTEIKNKGKNAQIISPQAAYLISDLLKSTLTFGTLFGVRSRVLEDFKSDLAAKTGTTQNWSDAWAIGYTPYITASMWIGFDKKGYSFGTSGTGEGLAAPYWAVFLKEYHKNLPKAIFEKPQGIITVPIENNSGLLPEGVSEETIINEIFISGTEPTETSTYFENKKDFSNNIEFDIFGIENIQNFDLEIETPDLVYLEDIKSIEDLDREDNKVEENESTSKDEAIKEDDESENYSFEE